MMNPVRKLVCTITLVGFAISSMAQGESDMDDRSFRFGLFASPNFGWVSPNIPTFSKDGLQPRFGFGYGALMDYKFSESPNYLFSTGFTIVSHGGGLIQPWDTNVVSVEEDTTYYYTGTLDRTYRLQYITVPLLLKMRTNEIGYMTYFGAIGMDVGFRTRAFANDNFTWNGSVGPEDEKDQDIKDQINFLKLALNISIGGEYNLSGNTNAYVGIGWHNTFTNIFRNIDSNRILEPAEDGTPKLDNTGRAIPSQQKKAVTNYISLDLGIFF